MSEETPKIDKDIEFKVPDTSVAEVSLPVTENIEFEKYKMKMNFLKWVLGTFAIAVMTIIIQWGFKDRAVGMDEIQKYNQYATDLIVLSSNPIKKRMLAQFFATVTPSCKLKKGWAEYYEKVDEDYKKFMFSDSVVQANYRLMSLNKNELSPAQKIQYEATIAQKKANDSTKLDATSIPSENLIKKMTRSVIYIQYSNQNKIDNIKKVQHLFDTKGWNAPGIEYLEKGCDNTIRYFNDEDRELANSANKLLGNQFKIKKINIKSPKGQIEIWIDNK